MKVLYDYQKFSVQRAGGITRYFAELFDHFSSEVEPLVSLKFNRNIYISGRDDIFLRKVRNYDFRFRGSRVLTAAVDRINQFYSLYDLENCRYDIFHPTYYNCYFFDAGVDKPIVVTVHDMIQEIFPEEFSEEIILQKKRHILESDHIVAVSKNTKDDILKFYPQISPDKISVIYHGASFGMLVPEEFQVPEKYLLFVGRRDGYKNFLNFLSAIIPLLSSDPGLSIVCAGEDLKPYEKAFIAEHGISDRIFCSRVSDSRLLYLYMKAEAFVFPSLYEGFGLPVLEAFRAGCPICLSDASCFPEIAGDAAFYFDPSSSESILETVSRCLKDGYARKKAIERGYLRLRDFSWEKSASSLEKVYAGLLG